MFEVIILAATPFITSWLVQRQKQLLSVKYSPNKKTILRISAAVLSFAGATAASYADGSGLTEVQIEQIVSAVLLFVSTQLPYSFGKSKS